ncbi:DEAD/DEAH box helicase [Stigmatella sp. ncwal1]|uniref:DEAD/DEAH box helicase n=1 Tax=Stigmatella ashevillensis TaxID=2995309 RepID=A0ABT5DCY9_9BACT|nr:DEAD/DEAH box helicase [Stigmatella ashevillena]MDC0711539.1 DEAD/DEAH box helicase [Stigmatella ashevillena]
MQFNLPSNHGLSQDVQKDPDLLWRAPDGSPSLTDVQHAALAAGVARGTSLLVVAPTSTGKTHIGLWALMGWLFSDQPRHAVYLVTHRALARQKFEELTKLLCARHFQGDKSSIALATGDAVEDGEGHTPTQPLEVPVLVATYEKYLAMVSGAGIREDMSQSLIICDEIQILGDESRGRNIEILLTLMKKARWGQLVGLSAVLDPSDAKHLSDWLGVKLIHLSSREKHLHYECRTPTRLLSFRTDQSEAGIQDQERPASAPDDLPALIAQVLRQPHNLPAIVFCTSKKRVYETTGAYARSLKLTVSPTQSLLSGLRESTAAARELSCYIPKGFAFHTADLLDAERRLVEEKIAKQEIKLVFATSTLAAGVNFPFKTAIFDRWKRWNDRTKTHEPLPASEFQNMAGRVGRMGTTGTHGSVLLTSTDGFADKKSIRIYLQPDQTNPLTPRITPQAFHQLSLQLVSSGMCETQEELEELLLSSFSATREQESNQTGLAHWTAQLNKSTDALRNWGFIL